MEQHLALEMRDVKAIKAAPSVIVAEKITTIPVNTPAARH